MLVVFAVYLSTMSSVSAGAAGTAVCRVVEVSVVDSAEAGFVNRADVVALLGRMHERFVGVTARKVDCRAIEKMVANNPFVSRVSAYLSQNGTLHVDVWQRQPAFRVFSGGKSYYVDNQRETMPTSMRFSAYVPQISGDLSTHFACSELFDFVELIENDDFWSNQITQICVKNSHDLTLVPRVGNFVIEFGSVENSEAKLEKLHTFYRKTMPKVGWNRYSKIDLRFENQVVCTKK